MYESPLYPAILRNKALFLWLEGECLIANDLKKGKAYSSILGNSAAIFLVTVDEAIPSPTTNLETMATGTLFVQSWDF